MGSPRLSCRNQRGIPETGEDVWEAHGNSTSKSTSIGRAYYPNTHVSGKLLVDILFVIGGLEALTHMVVEFGGLKPRVG